MAKTILSIVKASGPIKVGDNGPNVLALQTVLIARGYALHGTGYFGPATKQFVIAAQTARGMKATGIVDEALATSLDMPVSNPPPEPITSVNGNDLPPWLQVAIANIGVVEGAGEADNPVVLAMAKKCGGNIAKEYVHDSIPWCKMFTEFCLKSVGLKGIDTLWALDNAKVGTKLKGPAVGALACKKRTGGGHTFIVLGKDKQGRIVGVGGNQSDRVCRATFNASEIVSYNWPDGYPVPKATGVASLPIVDSAPLSKAEA